MDEWKIALIGAGSAILGSLVTEFFAWRAGHRQAEGAETAGRAQAALIPTVQATLDEQQRARMEERRRQTYAAFLAVHGGRSAQGPVVLVGDRYARCLVRGGCGGRLGSPIVRCSSSEGRRERLTGGRSVRR
ncbi:hypothetical protein [Streptomyces sp. NPDC012450]|uniref:hypothetical protein n=1 Tax=Streptomyces sp. NPDC012450 TaxID=3364834 RepID=UPI000EF75E46